MTGVNRIYKLLEAALDLASEEGWDALTLARIAEAADEDMATLYGVADKPALMEAADSWADAAMSAEPADMDDSPRERLFDVIMRRFEKMETRRAGMLTLLKARDRSAGQRTVLLKTRNTSAGWALAAAGLDDGTMAELTARRLGVAWVIARTEKAWRKDESGDFARTMATLDAELAMADERLQRLGRFRRKRSAPTPEASSPPEAPPAESAED